MDRHRCTRPVGVRSKDHLLSILSIECDRPVVQYFQNSSDRVAQLEELAEFVAARRDDPGDSDPDRVAIRLHHSSLPKLADAGIVDYDARSHTVRYRSHSLVEEHSPLVAKTGQRT